MKKSWSAAVAAAVLITGGGALHAMDYKISFSAATDEGGWSPFAYRYVNPTDEQIANAHVREINGEPVPFYESSGTIGYKQALNGFDYEDGFALWNGGKKGYRFTPTFRATSSNGAFSFGAAFNTKGKEHKPLEGDGWSAYVGYKNFELKAATVGKMGYTATVRTGGAFIKATSALFGWEIGTTEGFRPMQKGDDSKFAYYGANLYSAHSAIIDDGDTHTGLGMQWKQKLPGSSNLTLRLVNMHVGTKGYATGRDYDAKYPVGWNAQANFSMPSWNFSGTFKIHGLHVGGDGTKYDKPDAFGIAYHVAASTTLVPKLTLSAGYAAFAENLGNITKTYNGVEYDPVLWGHNVGLSANYRVGTWTFEISNTTSIFLLSEYVKAISSQNRYGWRPYIGESVALSAHKRINSKLTGNLDFSFSDANLNSYTDGKAEAKFSFSPNIDYVPQRGVKVNIALDLSLQNFSDQARGWWSDYGSDEDFGTKGVGYSEGSEIYYTYPHTFSVSIPISLSISI